MNWEKLDLHIENLIPGIVLLTIIVAGWPLASSALPNHEALLAVAFIGVAYMLGAVGNILARLLLDFVSQRTVRPYFLRLFAGEQLNLGKFSRAAINTRYSEIMTIGLSCGNQRIESEVAKRRQTGRLLRSALIPCILAILAFARGLAWGLLRTWGTVIAVYIILLLLYAYAEVTIFHEGSLGEKIKERTKNSDQGLAL